MCCFPGFQSAHEPSVASTCNIHNIYIVGPYSINVYRRPTVVECIGVRGRGQGGGQLPSQIRAKQWGKSGQSKKKKTYV